MKKVYFKLHILTVILLSVLIFGCTQQAATEKQNATSLSKEIKEIHPGILEGYLSKEEIPNSLDISASFLQKRVLLHLCSIRKLRLNM